MITLYEHDRQQLSQMKDLNQRSVYLLLKYWNNRPKRWNKKWVELESIYKDDSKWEYLVAKSLSNNGLDWIGGEELIDEKGNPYLLDDTKTWETNELGKNHIKNDFFELGL